MQIEHVPVADTGMLIRRPVAEVFEAFVNPEITGKFWFTRGSGRLEAGKQVSWTWEMYNMTIPVRVLALQPQRRILMEWGDPGEDSTVEWTFTARPDGTTFVSVVNTGFKGDDGDAIVNQALGSLGGFSLVLSAAKALLEHNIRLTVIADRFPDGLAGHRS